MTAALLLDNDALVPPEEAGSDSATVQVEVAPDTIDAGLQANDEMANPGARTVTTLLADVPSSEAVRETL